MSVEVKVSYESPQELQEVLERLEPILLSCKVSKTQKGRYKRAYIHVQVNKEAAEKCRESVM